MQFDVRFVPFRENDQFVGRGTIAFHDVALTIRGGYRPVTWGALWFDIIGRVLQAIDRPEKTLTLPITRLDLTDVLGASVVLTPKPWPAGSATPARIRFEVLGGPGEHLRLTEQLLALEQGARPPARASADERAAGAEPGAPVPGGPQVKPRLSPAVAYGLAAGVAFALAELARAFTSLGWVVVHGPRGVSISPWNLGMPWLFALAAGVLWGGVLGLLASVRRPLLAALLAAPAASALWVAALGAFYTHSLSFAFVGAEWAVHAAALALGLALAVRFRGRVFDGLLLVVPQLLALAGALLNATSASDDPSLAPESVAVLRAVETGSRVASLVYFATLALALPLLVRLVPGAGSRQERAA